MNAIVLAGGKGSRLQPWTAPKCLMPINGVSILHRLIKHLQFSGIEKTVVCTGYRADDVTRALDASSVIGVMTSCCGEDAPMGVRLAQAYMLLSPGRTLICYGDELADVDVRKLVAKHEHSAMTFTAALQKIVGGSVDPNGCIQEEANALVNIGFVVVETDCWKHLQPEDGLSSWINRMRHFGYVGYYVHDGKRATVNTLADLQYAEAVWQ